MSVLYDIILFMEKWFKYEFACPYCDSLVEYTTKNSGTNLEQCPICSNNLTLMSVVDATILSNTTKKEDNQMDTLTPAPQVMTLDWVENDTRTTQTYTESDVRSMFWVNKNLTNKQNEWYRKESQLRTLLEKVYADSDEQEILSQIADIFDVSLTKEVEVTAWVRVSAIIEVDMADGDYDLEEMINNKLTVDSYGSGIQVSNYEVERVEEGAY